MKFETRFFFLLSFVMMKVSIFRARTHFEVQFSKCVANLKSPGLLLITIKHYLC